MTSKPVLAACVVSYERAEQTRLCVEAINKHKKLPTHIYVADNGSASKEARALLDRLQTRDEISVIHLSKNHGAAYARNRVVEQLPDSIKYVAIMDNDMYALPGWDLAAAKSIDEGTYMVQPKLLEPDLMTVERGPNIENTESMAANPSFIGRGLARNAPEVNKSMVTSIVGAGIYSRALFNEVGAYDERLHVGEDYDLSFRAKVAGKILKYEPECEIVHDHAYDYSYDLVRGAPYKYLVSHILLWHKHRKVLLSPAYLEWYFWLYSHDQPMYMPPRVSIGSIPSRLARRANRARIMKSFPQQWSSPDAAQEKVDMLMEAGLDC